MKNLFTPLALLLLPSFNLKAQNVISPNNEKKRTYNIANCWR